MSGETERAPSGWTVDTLKEYLDTRMTAQDKAVDAALASAAKATEKSEEDVKAWRAQANEWRGAMSDRERLFATRREVDSDLSALSVRIDAVEKFTERGGGRSEGIRLSAGVLVSVVTVAVGIIVAVVAFANFAAR